MASTHIKAMIGAIEDALTEANTVIGDPPAGEFPIHIYGGEFNGEVMAAVLWKAVFAELRQIADDMADKDALFFLAKAEKKVRAGG